MFLLLFACAGSGAPKESTAATVPAVTYWYFGTSQGQTPDGSYVEDPSDLLFIRILDPEASTLVEQVWTEEGRGTWSNYELVHEVDIATETFQAVFVTAEGTLNVEGAYDTGPDWGWTGWHSTSTYQDGDYVGTKVESQDTVDEKGVVTTNKSIVDTTETVTWEILEILTPTTQEEFETVQAGITVK